MSRIEELYQEQITQQRDATARLEKLQERATVAIERIASALPIPRQPAKAESEVITQMPWGPRVKPSAPAAVADEAPVEAKTTGCAACRSPGGSICSRHRTPPPSSSETALAEMTRERDEAYRRRDLHMRYEDEARADARALRVALERIADRPHSGSCSAAVHGNHACDCQRGIALQALASASPPTSAGPSSAVKAWRALPEVERDDVFRTLDRDADLDSFKAAADLLRELAAGGAT